MTLFDENIIQESVFAISNTQTLLNIRNIPRCVELQPLVQLGGFSPLSGNICPADPNFCNVVLKLMLWSD